MNSKIIIGILITVIFISGCIQEVGILRLQKIYEYDGTPHDGPYLQYFEFTPIKEGNETLYFTSEQGGDIAITVIVISADGISENKSASSYYNIVDIDLDDTLIIELTVAYPWCDGPECLHPGKWELDGWDYTAYIQEEQVNITSRDLDKGCYFGNYNQKKIGTPNDWTWHDGGRSAHWAAPDKGLEDCWGDSQTLSINISTVDETWTVQIENVTLPIDSEEACELFIQAIESDKSETNCTAIDKGTYWYVRSTPICEIIEGCPPAGELGDVDKATGNINNFAAIA